MSVNFNLELSQPFHGIEENYALEGKLIFPSTSISKELLKSNKFLVLILEKSNYECKSSSNVKISSEVTDDESIALKFKINVRLLPEPKLEDLDRYFIFSLKNQKRKLIKKIKIERDVSKIAVSTFQKFKLREESHFNILVFGTVLSGKSSLIRSFYSLIMKEKKTLEALKKINLKEKSVQEYQYVVDTEKREKKYEFSIFDVLGINEKNCVFFNLGKFVNKRVLKPKSDWKINNGKIVGYNGSVKKMKRGTYFSDKKFHSALFVVTLEQIEKPDNLFLLYLKKQMSIFEYEIDNPFVVITFGDDINPFKDLETDNNKHLEYFTEFCNKNDRLKKAKEKLCKVTFMKSGNVLYGLCGSKTSNFESARFLVECKTFKILYHALEASKWTCLRNIRKNR